MKAYAIQDAFGIDALAPVERQTTTPHYGEARVRVQAVSLNYRDLMTVTDGASRNLQLPLIPLSDGAGEVVAVGEGGGRGCNPAIARFRLSRRARRLKICRARCTSAKL